MNNAIHCRSCNSIELFKFIDLGFSPPSNAYLTEENLNSGELYFPLRVYVCATCLLVQTQDFADFDQLFTSEYAYFSSTSTFWLNHAKEYTEYIVKRLNLDNESFVIEIGSNDGYLLKNFLNNSIKCLGVEPTKSTYEKSISIGVDTICEFFSFEKSIEISDKFGKTDLLIINNVYAHVPDINNFTNGIKNILKSTGVVTIEFPHVLNLIKYNQFDTIYHEHFSYFSLFTISKIFSKYNLKIFDVEKINTHGGSLRIFGTHIDNPVKITNNVLEVLNEEINNNLNFLSGYRNFESKVNKIKIEFIKFLLFCKENSQSVVGYGAAAKGNTLINYSGIKADLLPIIYDAAPSKQNKYTPGSHILIKNPEDLTLNPPDFIIIFPWNIKDEIIDQLSYLKSNNNTKFVVFIPELTII
jgi:hypothetical protein